VREGVQPHNRAARVILTFKAGKMARASISILCVLLHAQDRAQPFPWRLAALGRVVFVLSSGKHGAFDHLEFCARHNAYGVGVPHGAL
jgi:hypothetical protein